MNGREGMPDVQKILAGLKDFQLDTVNHVFTRLYGDGETANRFLIADEVGLGKTLAARGVIARAIEKLWDTVGRIDIIYICSSSEIARQNINRLNITGASKFSYATRLTMLPVQISGLNENKLNFISFTPGTSFNLRSSGGVYRERVVLYYMLKNGLNYGNGAALKNIFRCDVGKKRWRNCLKWYNPEHIDENIAERFIHSFNSDPALGNELDRLLDDFSYDKNSYSWSIRNRQFQFIGQLRRLLAEICLEALEPDIIILDEFQRFKNLLEEKDEVGELAGRLFNYQNEEAELKLILLSATPYKMYTVYSESDEDDHYTDFFRTADFLFNSDEEKCSSFRSVLREYREELFQFGNGHSGRLEELKGIIENILKQVMVRTEKLAASADRNGMITESENDSGCITPHDLFAFRLIDKTAEAVSTWSTVEYWKSAPYILNTMDKSYVLKSRFVKTVEDGAEHGSLLSVLREAEGQLLQWEAVQKYEKIDPGNVKLRTLIRNTSGKGLWQFLWLPPSYPYYRVQKGPYAGTGTEELTKSLIFSSWQIVPKVIAQLCSYEAEREIFSRADHTYGYSEESKKRRPLLNYAFSDGRLTGMPVFTLAYPCMTLALKADPMTAASGLAAESGPPDMDSLYAAVRKRIEELLHPHIRKYGGGSLQTSERWYWAAPLLLDREYYRDAVPAWLSTENDEDQWRDMVRSREDADEGSSRFGEHVDHLKEHLMQDTAEKLFTELGPPPEDLPDVLTSIALGSPAVTALRSLCRQVPEHTVKEIARELLGSAAYTAEEFRSLFNLPYATALIQSCCGGEQPYWRSVLDYCVQGNLQAVLDEYAHILKESLGLMNVSPADTVYAISEEMGTAVSIRTVNLGFDEIITDNENGRVRLKPHTLRCRFALRFGDLQDDAGEVTRSDQVRKAFNSPFHPFILATTSIGQEGLDFHQYCRDIYHWNIPHNPVDMEQREGRVHRYKGHAVRKNAAAAVPFHTLSGQLKDLEDVWETIFSRCVEMRDGSHNDLVPFWISDGTKGLNKYKICRHIPDILMSKEKGMVEALRRSLITYRMVLGQPRQEDLLRFLEQRAGGDDGFLEELLKYKIDLSPG
jgi:hypothetical protein